MANRTEQHTILLGGETVSYQLKRKQVKNINMRMRSETGLSVSAPPFLSLSEIESVLRQHQQQILKTLHEYAMQETQQQMPAVYATGESVLYLGEYHRLVVEKGAVEGVTRQNLQLVLTVIDVEDEEHRKMVFETWWNRTCERAVRNLCRAVFPIFEAQGVTFPEIRFRAMTTQWGNCRPHRNLLTFNTRLLAAPARCIEYVVMHELTHFLYPNHSNQFYAFIEAELPDWRDLQVILQKDVKTRTSSKR